MAESWRTSAIDDLCNALLEMNTTDEVAAFLRDLCTVAEMEALGHRFAAARLLAAGVPYADVAAQVGTSTTTVTRVAHWLNHGEGGYRMALARLAERDQSEETP